MAETLAEVAAQIFSKAVKGGRSVLRTALPDPFPHQRRVVEHSARWKVWRAGRRTGKTRGALYCAVNGHGPIVDGIPVRKGLLQGYDVVWVAPDYPQSRVIWNEDIRPRFKGVPGMSLNEQEHTLTVDGCGTLYIRSAEVIDGIRGIGSRLGGAIIDEAAHLDLEYAIRAVLRPALMDNQGWALFMSTTNGGPDGNAEKRLPSYFNVLCEEIRAGKRNSEWVEFEGTAYDNPALVPSEIDELVAEYEPESTQLQQEVFARLVRGGVGLALPEISAATHMVPAFKPPSHWQRWGAFDMGYNHPFAWGDFAANEDGVVYLVDSLHGRHTHPDQIAAILKGSFPVEHMWPIVAGHDCWAKRQSQGIVTPSVSEEFMSRGITLTQAGIDRVAGLINVRRYISIRDNEPRFLLMDTPGNRHTLAVLEAMQIDPKNLEDAAKMDASPVTGKGGDDPYDMVRYGLATRPLTETPVHKPPATTLEEIAWREQVGDLEVDDDEWNRRDEPDYGHSLRN